MDATDETPTHAGDGRRRWRDDPLSIFLIAAAVLLGAMYLWDSRQADQLVEQQQLAVALAEHDAMDQAGCVSHAAGAAGEQLVLGCVGDDFAGMARALDVAQQDGPTVGMFDEVVLVGSDEMMVCPPRPDAWVDGCARHDRPPPPEPRTDRP